MLPLHREKEFGSYAKKGIATEQLFMQGRNVDVLTVQIKRF